MKQIFAVVIAGAVLSLGTTFALAQTAEPAKVADTSKGKILVDAKDSGNWTVVVRDDGAKQWAYKGKPLYFWKDDKKAGDAEGDGRNNVWHIAAP